ncbi:MAG TPA: nucleotidyltransferase domain-containing protein, partial [Terracidiphilus sp.]|nr:nucleotidyltransferase domain-containing protein [Terracidiphilus sp.]
MGSTLEKRGRYSQERFKSLSEQLDEAARICDQKACVYATGSFGRFEASEHSDIDLFIVSLHDERD